MQDNPSDRAAPFGAVHVVGGGLAGSEGAWQLAQAGIAVVLHEMRPGRGTEAHQTDRLAELVCSNSFRSDDAMNNAVGLLHEEMRRCGSLILAAADAHKLPAGGALAVDRDGFAEAVTRRLAAEPLIRLDRGEVAGLRPRRRGLRSTRLRVYGYGAPLRRGFKRPDGAGPGPRTQSGGPPSRRGRGRGHGRDRRPSGAADEVMAGLG